MSDIEFELHLIDVLFDKKNGRCGDLCLFVALGGFKFIAEILEYRGNARALLEKQELRSRGSSGGLYRNEIGRKNDRAVGSRDDKKLEGSLYFGG